MEKTSGDGWVTLGSKNKKRRERKKKTKHIDQQQVQNPKPKSANTPPPMAVERPKHCFTREEKEISKILNRALEISAKRVQEPIEPTPTYRSPLAVKTSDYPKSRVSIGSGTTTPTQGNSAEEESDLKKTNVFQEAGDKETSPKPETVTDETLKIEYNKEKLPQDGVEQGGSGMSGKYQELSTEIMVGSSKIENPNSIVSITGSCSDEKVKRVESENSNTSEKIKMQWIFDNRECKLESPKTDRTRTPEAVGREKRDGEEIKARGPIKVGETELNPNAPSFQVNRARSNHYSTHNLATAPYHAPPVPWQPMTQQSFVPIWGREYPVFPQMPPYNPYPQPRQQINRACKDGRDSVLNLLLPYTSTPY